MSYIVAQTGHTLQEEESTEKQAGKGFQAIESNSPAKTRAKATKTKKKTPKKTKGSTKQVGAFIKNKSAGYEAHLIFLDNLLTPLPLDSDQKAKAKRLIVHLSDSTASHPDDYKFGFVPISAKLLEETFGRDFEIVIQVLIEAGIIQRTGYSKDAKKSREYRLNYKIYYQYMQIGMDAADSEAEPIDVLSGKKLPRRNHELYDENRNPIPTDIKNAILLYEPLIFDGWGLRRFMKAQDEELQRVEAAYGEGSKKHLKFLYKNCSGKDCYTKIKQQRPVALGDGFYVIHVAYGMQEPGRLTALGGVGQNMSRPQQAAAFARLQNDGIKQADGTYKKLYNYDMKSSQFRGWIQQLQAANIPIPTLLYDFASDDDAVVEEAKAKLAIAIFNYAESLLGDEDIAIIKAKLINLSKLMGADVSTTMSRESLYKTMNYLKNGGSDDDVPAPIKYIFEYYEETGDDLNKAWWAYRGMVRYLREVFEAVKAWHDFLIQTWINDKKNYYLANATAIDPKTNKPIIDPETGKPKLVQAKFVRNASGCSMRVDILFAKNKRRLRSKLAAHILQGQEALYIRRLVELSPEYGYKCMLNMHDGLITLGAIPEEAQQRAAQDTGTLNAKLALKNFKSEYAVVEPPVVKPGEPLILSLEDCFDPFELAEPNEPSLLLDALMQQVTGINYEMDYPELSAEIQSLISLNKIESAPEQVEEAEMGGTDEFLAQLIESIPDVSAQKVMAKAAAPKATEPVELSKDDTDYLEHVLKGIWNPQNERLVAVINEKPMYINAGTLLHWSFLINASDPFTTEYTYGLTFISEGGRLYCEPGLQVYGSYQYKESSLPYIKEPFTISCTGRTISTNADPIDEAGAIAITANLLHQIISGMKSY